jgi:hypothetical protein
MLYHFSDDPSIKQFVPRPNKSFPELPPAVWAIDEEHSPLYFFPRDCPRICYWPVHNSSIEDSKMYTNATSARMVITIESSWFEDVQKATLYMYTFSKESFTCFDEGAGYYITHETVKPLSMEPIGNMIERLQKENVELRLTPTLKPLSKALLSTTLHFSMIRMRNAKL